MDYETRMTLVIFGVFVAGVLVGSKSARAGERERLGAELDKLRDRLDRR